MILPSGDLFKHLEQDDVDYRDESSIWRLWSLTHHINDRMVYTAWGGDGHVGFGMVLAGYLGSRETTKPTLFTCKIGQEFCKSDPITPHIGPWDDEADLDPNADEVQTA